MGSPPAYKRVQDRKRQDRLDKIEEQLADGTLTIRHMTAEELAYWGPVKDEAAARKRAKRKAMRDAE